MSDRRKRNRRDDPPIGRFHPLLGFSPPYYRPGRRKGERRKPVKGIPF